MSASRTCSGCGRDLLVADEAADDPAECPHCDQKRVGLADQTVSRSMLIARPAIGAVPSGQLIARLEPGTFRWLFASDALAALLGRR
jgi:hypothetical protein